MQMNQMPMMSPFGIPQPQNLDNVLYVGDLEENINENILNAYFNQYGQIFHLRVMRDQVTKQSRGFAFITYINAQSAKVAKEKMNNAILNKKPIRVCFKKNMQQMDPDANIYIKNMPKDMTIQELENIFSKFGQIESPKISYDEQGKPLGYGYIQYSKKEDAQKCLEETQLNPIKFKEHQLEVLQYSQKKSRPVLKNNLYIKNLPSKMEIVDIENKLTEEFSKYGKLLSLLVKMNEKTQTPFAFVCYGDKNDKEQKFAEMYASSAKEAVERLNDQDIFKNGTKLYVTWFENKSERLKKLKQQFTYAENDTNLFTKNLKEAVTAEQLQKSYAQFGEITSCKVCKPQETEQYLKLQKDLEMKTQYGFINFKDKESARNAMKFGHEKEDIVILYKDSKSFYLNLLIKKQQYKKYIETKNRNQRFNKPQPNLMEMMQQMMPSFPFMMNLFSQFPFSQKGGSEAQQNGSQGNNPFRMPNSQMGQQGFMPPMPYMMPNFQMGGIPGMPGMGMPRFQQQQQQRGGIQGGRPNNFQKNQRRPGYGNRPVQQQRRPNQQQFQQPLIDVTNPMANQIPPQQMNQQIPSQQFQPQMPQQFSNTQFSDSSFKPQEMMKSVGVTDFKTAQDIKKNLIAFKGISQDTQRNILGDLIFPLVKKFSEQNAPKITGMLIDFEVFTVEDILEFFENESSLQERIQEAEELINQTQQQ